MRQIPSFPTTPGRFSRSAFAGATWLVGLIALLSGSPASAQFFPPGFPFGPPPALPPGVPLPPAPDVPPTAIAPQVSVAAGRPFGVASLQIPLANPVLGPGPSPLVVEAVDPSMADRVLLPISDDVRVPTGRRPSEEAVPAIGRGRLLNRVGNLIREIASGDESPDQTIGRRVQFLVRGSEPLTVRVTDARGSLGEFTLTPVDNAALRNDLTQQWWTVTTERAAARIDAAQSPPWVDVYLVAMLSRQLNLPLPNWYGKLATSASDTVTDPLQSTLRWITGAKDVSTSLFAATAVGEAALASTPAASLDVAAMPLPTPPNWQTTPLPEPAPGAAEVETEPLASRVPPECFYLRYGKFENYLWFNDLTQEYGGDISRMVTLSGVATEGSARLERQLGVKMTALSRMMGPSVIADQAIIGRDLMLDSGSSMGVLMQSTNAFVLRSSLNNDRQTIAAADPTVTLKSVKLDGGDATLLRSTDNRVRSFMVERDGVFLLTNSRTLASRFLQVAESKQSLAATPNFQNARRSVPLSRDDTIFIYVSPETLQRLLAPDSLIELRRRLQAEADMTLVRLARLAADAMGQPSEAIADLVENSFLPPGFGERPDGSGVVAFDDQLIDTRRGGRGTFLPIADATVDAVTATEAAWYRSIAAAYETGFTHLDPITIAVRRVAGDIDPAGVNNPAGDRETRERLEIHAEISPWQADQWGWWSQQLGPPTTVAMQFAPDDIVAAQAHVASNALGPPTHLFAAIKDSVPPTAADFDGLIGGYSALKQLPGYLGAWPQPGALDRLPLGLGRGQPVGPGMTRLIGGVVRYTGGGFSVLSFQPEILQASLPHLGAIDVADTAQLRVHVGDLVGSKLEGWVNQQLYERAALASAANAELLDSLHHQLGLRSSDRDGQQIVAVASMILGGDLQDPLGGQYQLATAGSRFTSTAWSAATPPADVPAGFQAPILKWFRGADVKVTQLPNRLVADLEVTIARGER